MAVCNQESGERILCLRLSGLGDVVHCLNALSALRRHRPDAHIAWVVEDRFSSLLEGHPHIDELLCIPRSDWGQMVANPLRWAEVIPELIVLGRELRQRRFDVSIDFQSSLKSAWLVAAAGARLRIGFDRPVSREFNRVVQNQRVTVPNGSCHRIERYLALLAPLGIPPHFVPAAFPPADEGAAAVDRALEGHSDPLIVIHPGTSRFGSFKRWPAQRYAEVAKRLAHERGASIVLTWGADERGLAEQVVQEAAGCAKLSPELGNLRQLAHLLGKAALFVGSDTGPMHLASALGAPVVALFGPKDPVQTGPYCSRSVVVTAPVECRPCTRRRCRDARCMTGITVEQVVGAACLVLDGGGETRAGTDGSAGQ